MKVTRLFFFFLCFSLLFLTCGCSTSEVSEQTNPLETEMTTPISEIPTEKSEQAYACIEGIASFRTQGELDNCISKAAFAEDPANLAALESYYLPTGIPEGYHLYKINVGSVDIGFWYLPEEYIKSGTTDMGEAEQKHYHFICGREHDFDAIVKDQKMSSKVVTTENFRYFIDDSGIFWEMDGTTFMLFPPKDRGLTKENLITLCGVEKHVVSDHVTE